MILPLTQEVNHVVDLESSHYIQVMSQLESIILSIETNDKTESVVKRLTELIKE